jgi:cytochrome P450
MYMYKGLTMQSRAASDLGFIFGLSSNAIPASCWMLLHILDPNGDKTLLPRVLAELETVRTSHDDGINISTLVSLPLIQSILQETLRLYTDVLVARDINADLTLPVDEGKRQVQFRKGDLVMVPSWLGQRDEERWNNPPHDVFYAERFLKRDPETGVDVFTMAGTAGKFFPFGGGKTICPGRVFAKQEVLAAVATVLLNYDILPISFLDGQGKKTDKFPCLAKTFGGPGVIPIQGDMEVRMKRRS